MNNVFDIKRLAYLIKTDLWLQQKTILIVAVTLIVVLALLSFPVIDSGAPYFAILYVGGLIITSLAFKDLHNQNKAHAYLLLPCSHLEKFICKWFLTTVAYIVATLILYYAFLLLSAAIHAAQIGSGIYIMGPLQPGFGTSIAKYLGLQSIVLLGTTLFKRNVLLKTILVSAGILLLINILKASLSNSLFATVSHLVAMHGSIIWLVVAIFFWYVAYLRITETELK